MRVINERSGQNLGGAIREARSLLARVRGLLGERRLEPGTGLWIEPCPSIHMFFMRFAIDAVFTDPDRRVVHVVSDLKPWRIALGGPRAHAVLELPVGTIEQSDTRPGDRLSIARG